MKKISLPKTIGSILLIGAIFLNYAHALNNYGIIKNNLYWKVLGQTSSSGSGNDSNNNEEATKRCPPGSGCQAGGCGASYCELVLKKDNGYECAKVSASPGYFACCHEDGGKPYANTYSQKDCCSY